VAQLLLQPHLKVPALGVGVTVDVADADDDAVDVGVVKFPELKKFDYGKALDSR
jgi:hypothetical protein